MTTFASLPLNSAHTKTVGEWYSARAKACSGMGAARAYALDYGIAVVLHGNDDATVFLRYFEDTPEAAPKLRAIAQPAGTFKWAA